jgi:nicotinamide-nucleotide amidase
MTPQLGEAGGKLGEQLLQLGWKVSTAESCTAGLLAWAITETAGSSQWFEQGLVTYSNAAKSTLLGVSELTLHRHGAVSQECALQMVDGVLRSSGAELALAVTGIAGPGGGSIDKPVGMVCFAGGLLSGRRWLETCHFSGDRTSVRTQAALHALALGLRCIQQSA